jgi:hypothetical protein
MSRNHLCLCSICIVDCTESADQVSPILRYSI